MRTSTSNRNPQRRPRSRPQRRSAEDQSGQNERRDASFKKEIKLRIHYFLESEEANLEMEAMNSYKRRVVHNMAKDYGITSQSEGDDDKRYVHLKKTEDTMSAEELSEIGPLEEELPPHSADYANDQPTYRSHGEGRNAPAGNTREGSTRRGRGGRGKPQTKTEAETSSGNPREDKRTSPATRGRRERGAQTNDGGRQRSPATSEERGRERGAQTGRGADERPASTKAWDFGSQTFPVQPGENGLRMALKQDGSLVLWSKNMSPEEILSERLVTTHEIKVRNGHIIQPNEEGW